MTDRKPRPINDDMEKGWRSIRGNADGSVTIDDGQVEETRRTLNDPESWTSIRAKKR